MFCSECGREAPADAKFCSGCGHGLAAAPQPALAVTATATPNGFAVPQAAPRPIPPVPVAPAVVRPLPLPSVARPQPAFRPTHRAPDGGLRTWAVADPTTATGPTIDAGVEVSIVEREGDWTRVACSNGWMAWVDGRDLQRLGPANPPATPAPSLTSPASASTMAFVGAGLIAVGAMLGWIRGQGIAGNTLDIPLLALIDYKASKSAVKLGFLVLALAGAGVAGALQPSRAWLKRAAGIGAAVVPVVFVIQLVRLLDGIPGAGLLDVVGFGVPVTLSGGLVLLFEGKIAGRRNQRR